MMEMTAGLAVLASQLKKLWIFLTAQNQEGSTVLGTSLMTQLPPSLAAPAPWLSPLGDLKLDEEKGAPLAMLSPASSRPAGHLPAQALLQDLLSIIKMADDLKDIPMLADPPTPACGVLGGDVCVLEPASRHLQMWPCVTELWPFINAAFFKPRKLKAPLRSLHQSSQGYRARVSSPISPGGLFGSLLQSATTHFQDASAEANRVRRHISWSRAVSRPQQPQSSWHDRWDARSRPRRSGSTGCGAQPTPA